MSHKIAVQSKITDKECAESALKAKGWNFTSSSNAITVTSGPMQRAVINLRTGEVAGDTDVHTKDKLGALSQVYMEHWIRKETAKQGGYVESCETTNEGTLRLIVSGIKLAGM